MKSILYAAAVLMAGACIYGFADYSKTKNKKEFSAMYGKKEHSAPAAVREKIPDADVNKTPETTVAKAARAEETKKERAGDKKSGKLKKKRKVSYEKFSRAALDEEVLIEVPEIKEEIKKEQ